MKVALVCRERAYHRSGILKEFAASAFRWFLANVQYVKMKKSLS